MPCRSDYPETVHETVSKTTYDTLRLEHDKVTRLLCEAGSLLNGLSASMGFTNLSQELKAWLKEHEKADKKRLAKDKAIIKKARDKAQVDFEKAQAALAKAQEAVQLAELGIK